MLVAGQGNNPGIEGLEKDDWKGLAWIVALIVVPVLAGVVLIYKCINGDQFVAIVLATLAFVAGRTGK
jgi:hypothetical protein